MSIHEANLWKKERINKEVGVEVIVIKGKDMNPIRRDQIGWNYR